MVLSKSEIKRLLSNDSDRMLRELAARIRCDTPHDENACKGLLPSARELHGRDYGLMIPRRTREHSFIDIIPEPEEGQIGIGGLDLRVGKHIAWSDTVIGTMTEGCLAELPHKKLEEGEEFILEHDNDGSRVYYITSFEQIKHSPDLEIIIDSKSTTGRVGCMSHYAGSTSKNHIITIVQPYSFPIQVRCGKTKLSQAVIRYAGSPYLTREEILACNKDGEVRLCGEGTNFDWDLTPKGLQMRFDTHTAYKARKCEEPIDMDAKGTLDWTKYFELVEGNSRLTCDKKTLYLLGSLGVIELGAVCGLLSREQEVMTGTGAWGHFAGVFQPFFRGGVTMEFYSHSKRRISRGDKAGAVIFDRVANQNEDERPKDYGGHYQDQKPPRLPKMFEC